ncbi:hypothetical protein BC827DRAFT_1250974 [Russula dissimulans]|nr:hypothetical protein BC827DRAFT_1250974 [Russula dissimulans]
MSDLNDNITSYNTGGMTSSLLEVLAGFALSTEEYTCTSSEAPSDSSLGRCQDVALLDLASHLHLIFVDYCFVHLLFLSA